MSECFCKWLIGGMGFAILGLVGVIAKMALAYRGQLLLRVARAETVAKMTEGIDVRDDQAEGP